MGPLIIGGNGQIGQLLIQELAQSGTRPHALIRDQAQFDTLHQLGADPIIGDLEDGIDKALPGRTQVVFTAGSGAKTGADKTILVDMWGAMKAIDAAHRAGVEHFVMVSSRGAEDPEQSPPAIKHYAVCKKIADDYLINSGLPYTILRPGRLTNDPATNQLTTEKPAELDDQWITRADVARAIAYCLHQPHTRNKIYPLFQGEQSLEDVLV